jgi:ABC-type Fe3+ transport system permease subunit
MSQMPPIHQGSGAMQPHRGTMILVFGILSLICCVIFGIVAWIMGNSDLRAMDEGRMDPSGRGLTQAGKICGIVSVVINCVGIFIYLIIFILGVGLAAAGAGGSGGGP